MIILVQIHTSHEKYQQYCDEYQNSCVVQHLSSLQSNEYFCDIDTFGSHHLWKKFIVHINTIYILYIRKI